MLNWRGAIRLSVAHLLPTLLTLHFIGGPHPGAHAMHNHFFMMTTAVYRQTGSDSL
jgi:hypothetical protein